MIYKLTMILLTGLHAYGSKTADLSSTTVPVLEATKEDKSALPASLVTGDQIKLTCSTDVGKVTQAKFYKGTQELPGGPAAITPGAGSFSQSMMYTTISTDAGKNDFKCILYGTATSQDSNIKTIVVADPASSPPPTTTAGGRGAASNSPVMAVFLLSIAAMFF